jgi:hypothetical protein
MLAHMPSQGSYEMAPFATGTYSICEAVAKSDSISIIGDERPPSFGGSFFVIVSNDIMFDRG